MPLKIHLNEEEKKGLNADQEKAARLYLRKHTTQKILSDTEAIPLYEMFMVGFSLEEIHRQYPQYEYGRICLTCAIKKWVHQRETAQMNIFDRIRARIVKSAVEEVEFLSNLITVNALEQKDAIRKYIADPSNNQPPDLRIKSLKDYQSVMDMLSKIVTSVKEVSPRPELTRITVDQVRKNVELPATKKVREKHSKMLEELANDEPGE